MQRNPITHNRHLAFSMTTTSSSVSAPLSPRPPLSSSTVSTRSASSLPQRPGGLLGPLASSISLDPGTDADELGVKSRGNILAPTGLRVMRQAQTMATLISTVVQMPVPTSQVTSMVVASRAWERRTTRATEMEQTLVLC